MNLNIRYLFRIISGFPVFGFFGPESDSNFHCPILNTPSDEDPIYKSEIRLNIYKHRIPTNLKLTLNYIIGQIQIGSKMTLAILSRFEKRIWVSKSDSNLWVSKN